MAWMILLMKEKDIGTGCDNCRFFNAESEECIADERVNVYRNGKISDNRPYSCPFRYYTDHVPPIVERFSGMTKEETKGWFLGADFEARHYARLEEERDRYVKSKVYKNQK